MTSKRPLASTTVVVVRRSSTTKLKSDVGRECACDEKVYRKAALAGAAAIRSSSTIVANERRVLLLIPALGRFDSTPTPCPGGAANPSSPLSRSTVGNFRLAASDTRRAGSGPAPRRDPEWRGRTLELP